MKTTFHARRNMKSIPVEMNDLYAILGASILSTVLSDFTDEIKTLGTPSDYYVDVTKAEWQHLLEIVNTEARYDAMTR